MFSAATGVDGDTYREKLSTPIFPATSVWYVFESKPKKEPSAVLLASTTASVPDAPAGPSTPGIPEVPRYQPAPAGRFLLARPAGQRVLASPKVRSARQALWAGKSLGRLQVQQVQARPCGPAGPAVPCGPAGPCGPVSPGLCVLMLHDTGTSNALQRSDAEITTGQAEIPTHA